jgi:hypothetical protein
MEVKITNAEAMNLFSLLNNMNVNGNAKFTYVIAKNRSILKPHIEALQETAGKYAKDHPEVKEYQQKVDDLLKKFAVDRDGKPFTKMSQDGQTMNRIIPPEKQADYMMAREFLDEQYKPIIVGAQLYQDEFARLLRKEETFNLRSIKVKDLPEGALNTQLMNLIFIFVEEDMGEVIPLKEVKKEDSDGAAA